jgi:hypothetical protein
MLAGRVSVLLTNVKESVRGVVPIIILIVFTILGGIIFMSIEGPNEKYELEKLKQERERLLEVYICVLIFLFDGVFLGHSISTQHNQTHDPH